MYSMVIADDEAREQQIIQKIVGDFCPSIRLLPCSFNGAELISRVLKEKPDIIVLDINMPILNGLDVLEWLRLKEISVKILMVSASSSFRYVQEAMNLGADGYLLKPVNGRLFAETVKKLCRALDREKHSETEHSDLENLKREYRRVLENELISDLLLEEVNPFNIQRYAGFFKQGFLGGGTCFIKPGNSEKEQIEQILTELNRFCDCFWKRYQSFVAVCILTNTEEQGERFELWVEELFNYVWKKIPFFRRDMWIIGISTWKASLEEFPMAMRESRVMIQGKEKAGFYPYQNPAEPTEKRDFHKEFYECRCLLRSGGTEEGLKDCVGKIMRRKRELTFTRVFVFSLVCAACHKEEEKDVFFGAYSGLAAWAELRELEDAGKIWELFSYKVFGREWTGKNGKTSHSYVKECLNYLESHYHEPISLETAAGYLGISSFYLSRVFRQETGKTFVEFLTNIRLLAALDKMWQGKESFQRITEQVGYDDVSYFYKLFKKKMGISASDMRRELKRLL